MIWCIVGALAAGAFAAWRWGRDLLDALAAGDIPALWIGREEDEWR